MPDKKQSNANNLTDEAGEGAHLLSGEPMTDLKASQYSQTSENQQNNEVFAEFGSDDELVFESLENPFLVITDESPGTQANANDYNLYAHPLQQAPVASLKFMGAVIGPDSKVGVLRTKLGEDYFVHEGDVVGNQEGIIASIFNHGLEIKEKQQTIILNVGKHVGRPVIPKVFHAVNALASNVDSKSKTDESDRSEVYSDAAGDFGQGGPGGPFAFVDSLGEPLLLGQYNTVNMAHGVGVSQFTPPETDFLSDPSVDDYQGDTLVPFFEVINNTVDPTPWVPTHVDLLLNAAWNTAPVFTSAAAFSVAENNTSVGTVVATDDGFISEPVTYSLSGTDSWAFSINATTGALSFQTAPDYDNPNDTGADNVYDLTVSAFDGKHSTQQAITVTVTDVNDSAPVFTSSATFSMAENATAVGTVVTTDADAGSTVSYSISGTDSAAFSINSSTGALSFQSAPDYESPSDSGANNVYDLTVTASDGLNSTQQAVAVSVTDVNEFSPTFTSSATFSLAENTTAVGTAVATDADGTSSISYSITGSVDDSKFSIDSSTGALTFSAAPDYETPTDTGANNVYDLEITASDGTNTTTQSVAVTVTDVANESNSAPVFTSAATVNVAENTTAVQTVAATDANGDTLTYSISGTDSAKFTINSSTGVLAFAAAPDVEAPTDSGTDNTYDLTLSVSDGKATTTQALAVTVTDVDDSVTATPTTAGAAVSYLSASTGDLDLDNIIVGSHWGGTTGQGIDLSYSFHNSNSVYTGSWLAGSTAMGPNIKATIREALDAVSSYTRINFHEVTETATVNGDLRFGLLGSVSTAFGYFPGLGGVVIGGDSRFGSGNNWEAASSSNNWYWQTAYHELGHTLGLAHPHHNGTMGTYTFGNGGGTGTEGTDAQDGLPYTVMSYQSVAGLSQRGYYGGDMYPGYMLKDIDALQYLYGSNNATNAGNTTYGSSFLTPNTKFYESIWDAGGTDTLDWSTGTTEANIDLDGGAHSFFGGIPSTDSSLIPTMGVGMGVVGLASDVVIENAIGGSGDDTLRGNTANNTLTGNAGFDSFVFDTLTGSDTITDFTALFDTLKFSAATFSAAGIANITAGSAINASDLLIGTSITSASSTGENFLYDSDSSVLYYDADGVAGGAVEIVDLGTNNTIDETDIVMIA